MRYLRFSIFFILLLVSAFSSTRLKEPLLKVEGTVLLYSKPVNGAIVTVSLDNKKPDQIITSRNGKFLTQLQYQKEYLIEVSKEGLVTKKINISTKIPGHVMAIGGVTEGFTDLVIPMLEKVPGMNTTPFNEPVTRFVFDEPKWLFVKDEKFAEQVAPDIMPILDKLDDLRKKAYLAQVQRGDSLMKARDYEKAYMAYQKSENYTDDVKYVKGQQKKAFKALKKSLSVEEEYDAAIAGGNSALEDENFSGAKEYYEKARMYKPDETYALHKIQEIDSINSRIYLEKKVAFDANIATADSLRNAGKYDEAGKFYRQALTILPEEQQAISKLESNEEILKNQPAPNNLTRENERADEKYESQVSSDSLFVKQEYDTTETKNLRADKSTENIANKPDEISGSGKKQSQSVNNEKSYETDKSLADNKKPFQKQQDEGQVKKDKSPLTLNQIQSGASTDQEPTTEKVTNEEQDHDIKYDHDKDIVADTSFSREAHEKRVKIYLEKLQSKKAVGDKEGQVQLLRSLGDEYHLNNEISKAITYYEQALKINKESGDNKETSNILNDMAVAYYDSGRYEAAVDMYIRSYEINEKLGNQETSAELLDNIGQVYENTYNYENALKYYEKSLDVADHMNEDEKKADMLNKIADVYYEQNDLNNAIKSYEKSLNIDTRLKKKDKIGVTLNNIGSAHYNLGDYEKAGEYFQQSLNAANETGDKKQLAISLNNIGNVNYEANHFSQAIDYYNRSINIKKEIHYDEGVSVTLHNIGNAYRSLKDENNAVNYYQQSLEMAKKTEYGEVAARNYKALAQVYASRDDYKQAYDYQRMYEDYRSSPSVSLKQITETQRGSELEEREKTIISLRRQIRKQKLLAQYEAERRIKDVEIKNLELKNKDAAIKKQKLIIYSGIIGTIGLLSILLLIIRQNIIKRRTNKMLVQKNELISFQKQQITDSIKYASRIQKAMLPPNEYIRKIVPQHFILNRPRDIVSGDYYWTTQRGDESIVSVADCTGHGVPGAFMSMLGIAFLNEIVNKKIKATSNEILDELRRHVIHQLHQKDKDAIARDGMDIALCIINVKEKKLQYSGAHNPLFIARKGELIEVKADKMPIGIGFFEKTEVPFKYHDVKLKKGDVIYIFSDGYADQFGSEEKKKFGIRRFKDILLEVHQKPMEEQHDILEQTIFDWKGDYEQIDDIMVMGIRID